MARQPALEGIIEATPEIEDAAREYVAARDARMRLTEREVALKAALIAAMKKHRLGTYKTSDGLECVLSSVDNVKVKGAKEGDE